MAKEKEIKCIVTGDVIDPAGGWLNGTVHPISYEGAEQIIEEYADRFAYSGAIPYWLYLLNQRFLKKRKRYSLPAKIRNEIFARYKFTCIKCGSKDRLEIDHIKPVSKGGTDELHNLQVLCKSCNIQKSNKL